jgi:hypothetical protein
MQPKPSPMIEALKAGGPAADREAAMALYGWLIGAWDVEVLDHEAGGAIRRSRGEWHFDWVLEGRAIQDVFIVPPRAERRSGGMPGAGNRCGTTLRVPNPADGTWRIDWSNPVTLARNSMIGRRQGNEIVQDGIDADGDDAPYRWVFSDIGADAFRWRAEISRDGGRSWTVTVEFHVTRAES